MPALAETSNVSSLNSQYLQTDWPYAFYPITTLLYSPDLLPSHAKTFDADILNPGYSEAGERLVAGVVPLSADKTRVLLIQSTRRGGWVLPKGGWETDESAQEAAKREAWEEAGVICTTTRDLGWIRDGRSAKDTTPQAPRALFQFYEVRVDKEEGEWPEKNKRGRMWMGFREARDALKGRPELLEALEKSGIVR